jgi:hypothetical protein
MSRQIVFSNAMKPLGRIRAEGICDPARVRSYQGRAGIDPPIHSGDDRDPDSDGITATHKSRNLKIHHYDAQIGSMKRVLHDHAILWLKSTIIGL